MKGQAAGAAPAFSEDDGNALGVVDLRYRLNEAGREKGDGQ